MTRKIAVITTSRADYSLLYWPLRDLASHPDVDLKIIALGPHLSPEFGCTVREIEKDGFPIDARIECLMSSDSDVGMAKTIGVATLSLADCFGQMRPDLIVLTADRYEMLAPASVALALRIPIAHIEGGEISEGAIDDAVRNALTKLSHVHFTSTEMARARVIAMGEEGWRVHRCSGSPAAQSAVEPRTTGEAPGHRLGAVDHADYVPSDNDRSGHDSRGGRDVCGDDVDGGTASLLLSEC
jgi:UDP-N-acetylglucosamine 2-epimerase (non-hydrolysing)/GDP/UDP-N,N'-diacetylbacillosamine 2-epimerase (hydrolysing)